MSDVINLPPPGFAPDNLTFYYTILSPPFEWIIRRGEGWVYLATEIIFKDGLTRLVEVSIGKYPTYPGYAVDLRLKSDLLLEIGLIDGVPPTIGRFITYPPKIGDKI